MLYNELTWKYFEEPAAAGTLAGRDAHRGAAGSPGRGTWVQFDVRVERPPAEGRIAEVRFLAFACPHVIAVAAWIAERAVGTPLRPELPESLPSLRERFGVPVDKTGRLLILEDAWRAVMTAAAAGR